MTAKDLRIQRAKLISDARALFDKPNATPEDDAKFDAMMAEADVLKARIDRIEAADAQFAATQEANYQAAAASGRPIGDVENAARSAARVQAETFATYMRRGPGAIQTLSAEHQAHFARSFGDQGLVLMPNASFMAALGDSTGAGGGFTIPAGVYDRLFDALKMYGGMLDNSFIVDTATGNPLPIPTDNDTTNYGAILTENTQVTTQDITFGQVNLGAYTYSSKLVLVANQLLQDSAFNLDSFVADKMGTRLGRITNNHFTVGSGAGQPTGVVTAATLGYTAGGSSSSGEVSSILTDDLFELEHSVDPAYRRAAKFSMNDTTLKTIKKLKDGLGRPLWLSGIAVKEPDTINGYPYFINQDMASPAASAITMLFGDFSNYFIRRVAGVQVLRLTERYADYNQTGFIAFQRWDGTLVDAGTHPIKYLQQSAS